jgi:hypothetical protein
LIPRSIGGWALLAMRWVLPAAIFATGVIVIAAGGGSSTSLEGGFMFMGAAFAVVLINVLVRLGSEGDVSRDREEEARRYLDEHGHWPDEAPGGRDGPAGGRR